VGPLVYWRSREVWGPWAGEPLQTGNPGSARGLGGGDCGADTLPVRMLKLIALLIPVLARILRRMLRAEVCHGFR